MSSGRAERAEKIAKERGIPAHFTHFEEMLDKAKPDIVSIATPPDQHFPMTMAALTRGIHVLCEKPFALSLEEAQQMKAAADHTAVVTMIDYEFRFLPARAYATELIQEGYVGDIRMAEFMVHFGLRIRPEDVGWDWWSDASKGGGLLGAYGSHTVDTLRLLMGPARRIMCDLATFVPERSGKKVTSDDGYSLLIEFQSGARAAVQMTVAAGVSDARFAVYGTEGQLIIPNIYGTELTGGKRADKAVGPLEIPARYKAPPEDHPLQPAFRVLLNRMVQAIDERTASPSPNFEDAVASQAMLDAARLSAREKRWVEII